ncbi:MAG: hypothetical protein ACE15C_16100 [Phycisphaerae bacterium]
MRILVTADLHYDIARSRPSAREVASRACAAGGDALVLVGDTAGAELGPLRDCLGLFAGFAGRKLLVPGNHCLWRRAGDDSLDRYERIIPQTARECGFDVLDYQPAILRGACGVGSGCGMGVPPARREGILPSPDTATAIGRDARKTHGRDAHATHGRDARATVGLVGSIGWYDYSFKDERLEVPEAFYRAKVAPGAAAYLSEHRHLVEAHRERLSPRHMEMGSRWMDGVHVDLGMSDHDFVQRLSARLAAQLAELAPKVDRIVAFIHHLPFGEMVPKDRPDRFAFAAAYMGSGALGEVLLACPKVTHVYCGHSHWPDDRKIGHLNVINVGSTYTEKRLVALEL